MIPAGLNPEINWIDRWAKYSPERLAFECGDTGATFNYLQSKRVVDFLCHKFSSEYQIEPGDRIAVVATNSVEYLFLLFVAQKLGAILVPINFRLATREFDHILTDSAPRLLIAENSLVAKLRETTYFEENITGSTKATCRFLNMDEGSDCLSHLVAQAQAQRYTSDFANQGAFQDPCLILYTSGTTGAPKGAVLTNESIYWNSINTSLRLNISQDDRTVNFAPLFHTGGWNVLTTPFLHRGASTIILKKFDPSHVLRLIQDRKLTIFFGVPTMLDMMAQDEHFDSVDLSSVRYSIVGGEPMPIKLIETWQKKGIPIRQGYGLTEFGPNVFSLNEEDAIRKIGSIGFPNFYIDTKVIDIDGKPCRPNEVGELLLRGPMCMKEYWNNQQATQSTIKDHWLYTGDLVRFDEEGHFYVVGRKKEMYISGGENVYPVEVEKVIQKLPGVREVAVIGVPDQQWGEVGKAFIACEQQLETDDILTYCKENLAKFKVPKYVQFLPELPKGDSGKILKKDLHNQQ